MKKLSLFRYFMLVWIGRANWTGLKYFIWGREYDMTREQVKDAANLLLKQRLIGLSFRSTHLTSYFIMFIHWTLTRRWVPVSHAWINGDDEENDPFGLTIWESVAEGVRKASFWEVILVDKVMLLKSKYLPDDKWDEVQMELHKDLGTAYDCKGDEKDHSEFNCIELVVFKMLAADPKCLPGLTKLMDEKRVLTPAMLIECGDFEIVAKYNFKGRN